MTPLDILRPALDSRQDEVLGYQINIDNYRLAIAHIDGLPAAEQAELADFRTRLAGLLASETHEQKKANVMLAVIAAQVREME